WIAFTAALDTESNLYARNLFIARPDGADLLQLTPGPRAGAPPEDAPKGIVRGRAVLATDISRRPLAGLSVTASGMRRPEITDREGNFQTYLPVGGGWVKLSGLVDGRRVLAWRFASPPEGRLMDLKDVPVIAADDDAVASPAWSSDGKQVLYVLRHSPAEIRTGAPRATLRRIRTDGSGDETLATFTESTIIAGPAVRGDSAWCKLANGTILRFDLKNKAVADSRPAEPAHHAIDFYPDGRRIVLDRHAPDGKPSIWILTLATKQLQKLIEQGSSPVW